MKVTVTASRAAWEALLRALPRCPCGELAEVANRGNFACLGCAASSPRAVGKALEHIGAAMAVADALSPHVPTGQWGPRT